MKQKPKEITVRVAPEEWELLNDKRHVDHEQWQSLGYRLFREWLKGEHPELGENNGKPPFDMSSSEVELVRRVLEVMRSGNKDAVEGIKSAVRTGELLLEARRLIEEMRQR